jgi:hypothetical protein
MFWKGGCGCSPQIHQPLYDLMNHLEKLARQYYEWKGYIVRGNVKVGRLKKGGWAGELDIVAYHPETNHLIHLEPSTDAHSWARREERFQKKFGMGRKHVHEDVFPWLSKSTKLEQIAMFPSSSRSELAGGRVITIDQFMRQVKDDVQKEGKMARGAIPEEFDLLRTIQLSENGYNAVV